MLKIVMFSILLVCGLCSALESDDGGFLGSFAHLEGNLEVTQSARENSERRHLGDADPCANIQCMNGGTCVHLGEDTFKCECPPRVSGKFCQIKAVKPKMEQMNYDEMDDMMPSEHEETHLSVLDSYLLQVLTMQSKQLQRNTAELKALKAKSENDSRKIEEMEEDIQSLMTGTPAEHSPFIIGGDDTPITNFPWQVAVLYSGNFICGGTIVSKRWIVTAAHCVSGRNRKLIEVIVGSSSIKPWGYLPKDRININGYLMHRSYSGRTTQWRHDLALVQLSQSLTLDAVKGTTRAIELPNSGEVFEGKTCTISGYGRIESISGPLPNILQAADVPVVSNDKCETVLKNNALITSEVVIHDEQMCAGAVEGGKGICAGDSGSPLSCERKDGSYVLAGIVSSGFGCARAETFGVFTRMSVYKNAIQAVLNYYGP